MLPIPIKDCARRDALARLRFSIIGPLLAAPPKPAELQSELARLGARVWRHPISGLDITFATSTLERWYYLARRANDPVAALKNRLRGDIQRFPSLSAVVIEALT